MNPNQSSPLPTKILSSSNLKYRPEIDGLRGIAVLSVLLFHAGEWLPGGFVGVDIFFVISGYLITAIILRSSADGTFTLAGFYERRARRILPALYSVIIACLIAGYWLLMPLDFKSLADSAIAQVLMASNIYFYSRTGYFATSSEAIPLLHTWSLSLEEQFYLLYPILIYFFTKRSRAAAALIISITGLLSFAASITFTNSQPEASFFLLPTRAWELLAGSALAYLPSEILWSRRGSGIYGWIGLGMITAAVLGFSEETSFPGYAAAMPVCGTILILGCSHSGNRSTLNSFLSIAPLRFAGLISYSLYLWHWPILVFLRYRHESLSNYDYAITILLTIIISSLSFVLIEAPVRAKAFAKDSRQLILVTSFSAASILAASGLIELNNGMPRRFDQDIALLIEDTMWNGDKFSVELTNSLDPLSIPAIGTNGTHQNRPDFMIWGDSHAMVLTDVVEQVATTNQLHGRIVATHSVPPVPGGESPQASDFEEQVKQNLTALEYIKNARPRVVILAARWGSHYDPQNRLPIEAGIQNPTQVNQNPIDNRERVLSTDPNQALSRLVEQLSSTGIKVWIIAQIPETAEPNNARDFLMWIVGRRPRPPSRVRTFKDHLTQQSYARTILASAELAGAIVVDPADQFFDINGKTINYEKDRAVYRDNDHVTRLGAEKVKPIIEQILTDPELRTPK